MLTNWLNITARTGNDLYSEKRQRRTVSDIDNPRGSLSGSSDKANFRLSYTNLDQTGILENTFLKRNTVSVNGGTDITKKFKVATDITYTQNRGRRPGLGYDAQT